MKIYYEPYLGYNKRYDFRYPDTLVLKLSFIEPEEPKLMREIGVDYIVKEVTEKDGFKYSFTKLSLMEQLLPEQMRVLLSHAYRICNHHRLFSKFQFIRIFRNEVKQIAEQEIEPGMFKDEDIL
ncbi:MAG: hypothetical protein ACXACY_21660 [Candidatus Hodarchaeales archaeon]|jgi:hypothetical protein